MLLKLDFQKAFDKIEPAIIPQFMLHIGLLAKWIEWVRSILGSDSSYVLLNGVPSKSFKCKRGVRQGDPLSPLIFVLGADLLQSFINKAAMDGVLSHPVLCNMLMTPSLFTLLTLLN